MPRDCRDAKPAHGDHCLHSSPDEDSGLDYPSNGTRTEAKNYPLLPLARGAKLEQFIELCMQQGLVEYLRLTLDIGLVTDPM
ncbi:hypothetical protein KFU94_48085 [Chloroflexi bacterium TSY]|nr:hypothetical protein [Chloroflexi bacterium TSY]